MPTHTRRLLALVVTALMLGGLAAPVSAQDDGGFVTRQGGRLWLDGKPFRFGGPNIYWLGLDENVGGIGYPTKFRITDALRTARGMGATVVRSHTLGVSTGHELSLQPTKDTFNDKAFESIDHAVAQARRLGLKLVIPLTDNWTYYHGGYRDFTRWFGVPDEAFFTDPQVIAAFKRYIDYLLNHINPSTGLAYRDDPTILAWELGNELNGMPAAWVDDIAAHLKRNAPRHLVAAGSQQGVDPAALASSDVDIVDVHYYPPTVDRIRADAAAVGDAGKVYIAGEYGSGSATPELLNAIATDANVSGALFWSLFGHRDDHGYVQHDDGFTVHYPGDDAAMRDRVAAIGDFSRAMCECSPHVSMGRPIVTSTSKRGGMNVLAWRGATLAHGYHVQRLSRGGWETLTAQTVSDNDTPWMDLHSPRSWAIYRVIAVDASGQEQHPSWPVFVAPYSGPNRPPSSFNQLTPASGAESVKTLPTFTWTDPGDAAYFRLVVSKHPDLTAPIVDEVVMSRTTLRSPTELELDQTYYWTVSAVNVIGSTPAANAPSSFTTGRPTVPTIVDDYSSYPSDTELQTAYRANPGGGTITPSLSTGETGNGMRLDYTIGAQGYAGVIHDLPAAQDWWGYEGLRLWIRPDGTGRNVTVQFVASGTYWETTFVPTGTSPSVVSLPFSTFRNPPWATPGPLDLNSVTQLSIYVGGGAGSASFEVDSFQAYPAST